MKKAYSYFAAGVATVLLPVGTFYLIIFLVSAALEGTFAVDNKGQITVLATNISPNRKYVATTFGSMGGGAAGWCSAKVKISRGGEEFNQDEVVFSSHCGIKIKTEWENDGSLRITYSKDEEIVSMYQRGWNEDKTVKIIYSGE